jgi:hypothetical protein
MAHGFQATQGGVTVTERLTRNDNRLLSALPVTQGPRISLNGRGG